VRIANPQLQSFGLQIRNSKRLFLGRIANPKQQKTFPGADCKSETAKETAKVDLDMLITNPK
jgi:hypothetical protein